MDDLRTGFTAPESDQINPSPAPQSQGGFTAPSHERIGASSTGGYQSIAPQLREQTAMPTAGGGMQPAYKVLAEADLAAQAQGKRLVQNPDGSWTPQQVEAPHTPSSGEQLAAYDAYKQQYGFGEAPQADRGQQQLAEQAQYQQSLQQGQSGFQNFSNAGTQGLARVGTGLLGTVAPQTAGRLQQNVEEATPVDRSRLSGTAGDIAGMTLPLAPAMLAGGAGPVAAATPAVIGAQAFGNARAEAAQRRAGGQDVGLTQELTNAGLQAAIMYLGGKIGLSNIARPATAPAAQELTQAIFQGMKRYATTAGLNASDAALMQLASNAADKYTGVAPERGLTQGVGTAAAVGGLTSPLGQFAHDRLSPTQGHTEVPVPSAETLKSLKTGPADQNVNTSQQVQTQGATPPAPSPQAEANPARPDAYGRPMNAPLPAEAEPTGLPLVDKAEPVHRVHEGPESTAVPLQFESAEDKALFLASQPRKGKVSAEAMRFLSDRGYTPEIVEQEGSRLREEIDSGLQAQGMPKNDKPFFVPKAQTEGAIPVPSKFEGDTIIPAPEYKLPPGPQKREGAEAYLARSVEDKTGFTLPEGQRAELTQRRTPLVEAGAAVPQARQAEVLPNEAPNKSGATEVSKGTPPPTEEQILAANADLKQMMAGRTDTTQPHPADHQAAVVQKMLADYETAHGEDAAESLIERMKTPAAKPALTLSGGKRAGAVAVPETLSKFVEEDVAPKVAKAAEGLGKLFEGVKAATGNFSGEGAEATRGIMRERGAELAQRSDQIHAAFDASEKAINQLPVDQQRAITDAAETGRSNSLPSSVQKIAGAIQEMYRDRLQQIKDINPNFEGIENYMGHAFKDPKTAADTLREFFSGKRPLQGNKGFLKERNYPTQADAIAAGLEPLTDNPVTMMRLKLGQMDKYITAQNAFEDLKGQGLLKQISARSPVPDGYTKINDNIATIYAPPNSKGGISIKGYLIAPDPVAGVINNHLSPGIRNNEYIGPAFRGYLTAGNVMNQSNLGLSAFHAVAASGHSAVSEFGLGIKRLLEGHPIEAAQRMGLGLSIIGPAGRDFWNGTQLLQEWKKPGSTGSPELAMMADAMKAAGGRAGMDSFYHTDMTAKMQEAFKKGNTLGGVVRAPLAGLEQVSKPIMEYLVPRLKMGAFMQMARGEIEKLGPEVGRDELRQKLGKAWDSVDNRFGEIVHDNLFWNQTLRDVSLASVRSVGWNLGTFRELGGGVKDYATLLKRVATERSLGDAEFTHRMAFTTALPVLTGIIGGVVHYMMTGERPKEWKDLYYPKTGEKDASGHDVRMALPSYMKDIYAFKHDPKQFVENKAHPMLSTILEMLNNKDYYGNQIRNADDPVVKQGLDLVKHLGANTLPISVRDAYQSEKEGQGTKAIAPFFGFTHAPGYITKSPAEQKAAELMQARIPAGGRTQETADKAQRHYQLMEQIHQNPGQGNKIIGDAVRAKEIGPDEARQLQAASRYGTGLERTVHRLGAKDGMKVWDAADKGERDKLRPMLMQKVRAARDLSRDERVSYMKTLQGKEE